MGTVIHGTVVAKRHETMSGFLLIGFTGVTYYLNLSRFPFQKQRAEDTPYCGYRLLVL